MASCPSTSSPLSKRRIVLPARLSNEKDLPTRAPNRKMKSEDLDFRAKMARIMTPAQRKQVGQPPMRILEDDLDDETLLEDTETSSRLSIDNPAFRRAFAEQAFSEHKAKAPVFKTPLLPGRRGKGEDNRNSMLQLDSGRNRVLDASPVLQVTEIDGGVVRDDPIGTNKLGMRSPGGISCLNLAIKHLYEPSTGVSRLYDGSAKKSIKDELAKRCTINIDEFLSSASFHHGTPLEKVYLSLAGMGAIFNRENDRCGENASKSSVESKSLPESLAAINTFDFENVKDAQGYFCAILPPRGEELDIQECFNEITPVLQQQTVSGILKTYVPAVLHLAFDKDPHKHLITAVESNSKDFYNLPDTFFKAMLDLLCTGLRLHERNMSSLDIHTCRTYIKDSVRKTSIHFFDRIRSLHNTRNTISAREEALLYRARQETEETTDGEGDLLGTMEENETNELSDIMDPVESLL